MLGATILTISYNLKLMIISSKEYSELALTKELSNTSKTAEIDNK